MAFRNIVVENPARITARNKQLIITTDAEHSVAIEDISALLLENRQITISTAALSRLGQCGCAVFTCDERHMPCGILLPYMQHSRELSVIKNQLSTSEPLKKRLWQAIVKGKIRNQAVCLRLCGRQDESNALFAMEKSVRSGDPENIEATAAQFYFPALFGAGFTRSLDNGYNAALNYGYAILRGSIAHSLAVYGFLPALGVHHRNQLNAFNLADDLIEPFRPVIDLLVYQIISDEDELTPSIKRQLFNCLNLDILSGAQHHCVSHAIERLVQSLARAFNESTASLCLPELLALAQHGYE